MNNQLLSKTMKYLEHLDEVYRLCMIDEDYMKKVSDEDKYIFLNPMLHLAEAICDDTNCFGTDTGWAIDLAKYILLINGITDVNVKTKITLE